MDYEPESEFAPYVAEWGKCAFEDAVVRAYRFANQSDLEFFLLAIKEFGLNVSQVAIDDLMMLAPDDSTKLGAIREELVIG